MVKAFVAAAALVAAAVDASAAVSRAAAERLDTAARNVLDIRNEIPDDVLNRARCVAVIPDLKKAAFIVGGEYGKGVMSCRAGNEWTPPVFLQLAKGSWGFQAGVEQVDLVLLVMNERGVQKLLQNKTNLGADASAAAGPVGRRAAVATDAMLTAEILSYSRSHGLFAGVDVSGGVLRPDEDTNHEVYGPRAEPRTLLASRQISAPPEARAFLDALRTASAAGARTAGPAPTEQAPRAAPSPSAPPRVATQSATDDLRARIVDIQQALDRILAETTPAATGTTGTAAATTTDRAATGATVVVDRARLMQLRQQLDQLLAAVSRQ
jgi:lipid-binding SYLF domain-containing protein